MVDFTGFYSIILFKDADPATPLHPIKRRKLDVCETPAPDDVAFLTPQQTVPKPSPSKAALKTAIAKYKKRWLREKKKENKRSPQKKVQQKHAALEAARDLLKEHLTQDALNLVMAQITAKGRRRKRWSKEVKLYCLSLAYTSTAAYKFLRKTFKIPSIRTLQRMFQQFDVDCGFSPQLFEHLRKESSKMKLKDRYCTICFDEVALTSRLSYHRGHDVVNGFVNFGDFGQSKELGNHGLVFMASGLLSHWKQPLGYFISRNTTPSTMLKELLFQCLALARAAGLIVKGIVCDMGATNQKFLKDLGVDDKSPFIDFNGDKVFVFFDPPHLLKCIRNNLFAHDILVAGQRVSWEYIREVFRHESQNSVSLRTAPKLTAVHVNLGAFKKMKVKTAAQVMSQSVSAAILTYICSGALKKDALPTALFLKKVDSLFDVFNSSSRLDSKIFRRAIHKESASLDFLRESVSWLDSIQVLGLNKQPPSIKGWKQSINALLGLWEEVAEVEGITYLCTRKISQDVLENSFSLIRGRGYFNMYPCVSDFQQAYKMLLLRSCISNSTLSNCEEDSAALLLDVLNIAPSSHDAGSVETAGCTSIVDDRLEDLDPRTPQGNVLLYVAGYAAHRCLRVHACSSCESALLGSLDDHIPASTVLMVGKAYRNDITVHGSLRMPSAGLLQFIRFCETVLQSNVVHLLHMPRICTKLTNAIMKSTAVSLFPSVSCPRFNISKLVSLFVRMRIMYIVKFMNTRLAELPKGKRNLRAIIVEKM